MPGRLEGKRVLLTQADDYMGPAIGTLIGKPTGKSCAELLAQYNVLDDPRMIYQANYLC